MNKKLQKQIYNFFLPDNVTKGRKFRWTLMIILQELLMCKYKAVFKYFVKKSYRKDLNLLRDILSKEPLTSHKKTINLNMIEFSHEINYPHWVKKLEENIDDKVSYIIPPIKVILHEGKYLVVDGNHRLKAYKNTLHSNSLLNVVVLEYKSKVTYKKPFRLDFNFLEKWVRSLLSGNYKQGQFGMLQKNENCEDTYCCLGVAAKVVGIPSNDLLNVSIINTVNEKNFPNYPKEIIFRNEYPYGFISFLTSANDGTPLYDFENLVKKNNIYLPDSVINKYNRIMNSKDDYEIRLSFREIAETLLLNTETYD